MAASRSIEKEQAGVVLVLQDLKNVLEQAEVEPNVTMMPHDFFKIQTVKGKTGLQSVAATASGHPLDNADIP